MTTIAFTAMPTEHAERLRAGGPDAYGRPAERHVSDGDGNPCRHCLDDIGRGEGMLVASYRPFPAPQAYAETGPIFLHAETCARWTGAGLPPVLARREHAMVRAYDADDRIVYGTGRTVATATLDAAAAALLARPEVRYVHVRSASNGCFTCRIDRVGSAVARSDG
jgi:hypothetical protein